MKYGQALRYLDSFINYERLSNYAYNKAFGLERIKKLLELLGNPQKDLRCIHVAGTKGKGSTCAFIAYILREAGYRVGLYTSPHLEDFRERIRILEAQRPRGPEAQIEEDFEGMISKPDLSRLVEKIKKTIDDDVVIAKLSSPTFFEIYTALAFFYFKQQNVDFAVLETGLGGRLDATNVINPLVSVITPISLEHTQYLGNTLCQIANEKAGIIKKLVNSRREPKTGLSPEARRAKGENRKPIVITAPQEKEVLDVIKKRCKSVDARLYQPKTDKTLRPRLLGAHQLINASVAKASIETLGLKIKSYVIIEGIRNTVWPARCEVISTRPLIVLDGAQNVASVKALKNAIQDNFKYNRLLLILGISVDKDIAGICKELASIADRVIITKSKNPRAAKPQTILRHLTNLSNGSNLAKLTHSVKDALDLALKLAAMDDLILATGSLFMVGELRRLCRN